MKVCIVELWEIRKLKLWGGELCPGPHSESSGWDLGPGGTCELANGMNDVSDKLNVSDGVVGSNGGSAKLNVACPRISSVVLNVSVWLHILHCLWVCGHWQFAMVVFFYFVYYYVALTFQLPAMTNITQQ